MASAENTKFGVALQTAAGAPNITEGSFDYLLYSEGALGPQNMIIPTDPEVGGGAMISDLKKVGISSAGAINFIPRAKSIGKLLYAALGKQDTPAAVPPGSEAYAHTFNFGDDQFDLPYLTVRYAPGNLQGEIFKDCRIAALNFSWQAANFLRAQVAFIGKKPELAASVGWNPSLANLDNSPQFMTTAGSGSAGAANPLKMISGSLSIINSIPLDEQMVVGSYEPDALDVVSRAITLQVVVKVSDAALYKKVMYDPAGGTEWVPAIMKDVLTAFEFKSDQNADATNAVKYALSFADNMSATDGNVAWTAQPLATRAGKTIVMALSGMFLADTNPFTAKLTNRVVAKYAA